MGCTTKCECSAPSRSCVESQRLVVLPAGSRRSIVDVGEDGAGSLGWLLTFETAADATFVLTLTWPGDAGVSRVVGSHSTGCPDLNGRTVFVASPILSIEANSAGGGTAGVSLREVLDRSQLPPGADSPVPGWGAAVDAAGPASWSAPAGARSARVEPLANANGTVAVSGENAGGGVLFSYAENPSLTSMSPRGVDFRPIPEGATLKANSGAVAVDYRPTYLFPLATG